jgi:hypothetical protein
MNPYLSASDVVVVVLVVHELQHFWYEDDLMYLPTFPADATRRCRPRPRPRRDCCSAWRLRHLLRAENTGFKKHLHGRNMWGEGGGQIPPLKCTPKCTPYVNTINLRLFLPRCYCWSLRGALRHRQKQQGPTTTATCYVGSLSQARGEMRPGKDFLLKCRSTEYMCCLGGFPRT